MEIFKYRRIGDLVNVKGHCSTFTWDGSGTVKIGTVPAEIAPTNTIEYLVTTCAGRRIVRMGVHTNTNVFLDYIANINDNSNCTTSVWLFFNFCYLLL